MLIIAPPLAQSHPHGCVDVPRDTFWKVVTLAWHFIKYRLLRENGLGADFLGVIKKNNSEACIFKKVVCDINKPSLQEEFVVEVWQ